MGEPLKNFVGPTFVKQLSRLIKDEQASFNAEAFERELLKETSWEELELKQRVRAIAKALGKYLAGPYQAQLKILKKLVPHTTGLGNMIYPDFVEVHGADNWDASLEALKYFTVFFSSEFAIRPFILRDPARMLALLQTWSLDKNEHVRRLASEGLRPRLPWSFRLAFLMQDPTPVLPILENLKADPSDYVRRSVANHLNDISKDHPDLVLRLAKSWVGKEAKVDAVLKHALRGLLRRGEPRAMAIFKLKKPEGIDLSEFSLSHTSYRIGTHFTFQLKLKSRKSPSQKVRLDYAVFYRKKNGSYGKRIFKLTERVLVRGEVLQLERSHSLRQMTTRVHYPGEHFIELIVNGVSFKRASFSLRK